MHFFPLPAVFVGGEIVDMLSNTGAVAKLVLLTLLAFSLISWAIILTKWSLLRRAKAQSGRFVRAFRKAQRLQDIVAVADQFKPSPLVGVFEGGYEEYRRQVASSGGLRSMGAHHTPARQVCARGFWDKDDYNIVVEGKVEETSIFGWNLCLTRHISSRLGKNQILIRDVVENAGFEPTPHMLLYHFNFGFPLLDLQTQICFPSADVIPREPELPIEGLDDWLLPQTGYQERVYYHEQLSTGVDGMTAVTVRNPHFTATSKPLMARLAWQARNLPVLVQWKMPGEGTHVLGLEPANCHVEGRLAERERGSLVLLEPGQSAEYNLDFSLTEE